MAIGDGVKQIGSEGGGNWVHVTNDIAPLGGLVLVEADMEVIVDYFYMYLVTNIVRVHGGDVVLAHHFLFDGDLGARAEGAKVCDAAAFVLIIPEIGILHVSFNKEGRAHGMKLLTFNYKFQ